MFWRKPPLDRPALRNTALDHKLGHLMRFDIPLASAQSLHADTTAFLLDVRTREEFEVSHIAGAHWVNPNENLPAWLDTVSRERQIVVYCSVGYRSEGYGRALQAAGFTEVSNLYGSLFEWVDRGYPVIDSTGNRTHAVHTYNQRWSRWLTDTAARRVW